MRGTTLAVALLILTAGTAFAGDLELYTWRQELSGTVSGTDSGLTGTGMVHDNESSEFGIRTSVKLLGREFELGYVTLENTATVDGTFEFAGVSFSGTSGLNIDATMYEFFPKMTLGEMDENSFKFIFGLKVMDYSATAFNTGLGVSSSLDETIPIPQIGVRLVGQLGKKARLDFTYKWLDVNISSVDVKVIDVQVDLAIRLQKGGDAVIGWRKFDYEITSDGGTANEARVDLEHSGPYVGWRMTF